MEKYAEQLLTDLVEGYILFFQFRDGKKIGLLKESVAVDQKLDNMIFKIVDAMETIEYDATGELGEYVARRKVILEIKSILSIARSHPESATKRLKGIREKWLSSQNVMVKKDGRQTPRAKSPLEKQKIMQSQI